MPVADPAGQNDRTVEEGADRPGEGEGVHPAGLPARAGGEQDESVDAGRDRLAGVLERRHIGEDEGADIVQRLDHRRRGADAGDHYLHPVGDHDLEMLSQPRVADDQVGAVRRRMLRRGGRLLDLAQPAVELDGAAGVGGREGADRVGPAGGGNELHSRDVEHRRHDQRQTQARRYRLGQAAHLRRRYH